MHKIILLFLLILSSCKKENLFGSDFKKEIFWTKNKSQLDKPLYEIKFSDLLKTKDKKYEASGIFFYNSKFYIVFDNLESVLELNEHFDKFVFRNKNESKSNFEAIHFDEKKEKFFIAIESTKFGENYSPEILEFDKNWNLLSRKRIKLLLEKKNKGIEGLSSIWIEDKFYLLALCEGNFCYSNKEKHKGNGKILVLKESIESWEKFKEISIPEKANFLDYSDMDRMGNTFIISSQESSAIWIGELDLVNLNFSTGEVFKLPFGDKNGNTDQGAEMIYCNIEGVSFISQNKIVLVSDKASGEQDKWCNYKDQMLHIFDLPKK